MRAQEHAAPASAPASVIVSVNETTTLRASWHTGDSTHCSTKALRELGRLMLPQIPQKAERRTRVPG